MQADLAEKATKEPPKLGRHRYKELPIQVLSSDDVTGCLRTLRTTPQVTRDRFKSLQKRGIIQVCSTSEARLILCTRTGCGDIWATCKSSCQALEGKSLCTWVVVNVTSSSYLFGDKHLMRGHAGYGAAALAKANSAKSETV
jgi:hypothetical protein